MWHKKTLSHDVFHEFDFHEKYLAKEASRKIK